MKQAIIIRDEVLRKRVIDLIRALNLDKPWRIILEPHRKRRSLSQNSLMWVWINEAAEYLSEHTGHDNDFIHQHLKEKFLSPEIAEINGQIHQRFTTTKLTTQQMSEYMEKIYAYITSEFGILLPIPEKFIADRQGST